MKRYKNNVTGEIYIEGQVYTKRIDEHTVWSGYPTEEQLSEWGFVDITKPKPTPRELRMREILNELDAMDYLTSKYVDGEDMSEYGDWQGKRKALREEYRELEKQND